MRLLRLVVLSMCLVLTATGPSTGHPPPDPDHGVNATTFPARWSGDVDGPVHSGSGWTELASATDVAFDAPPADVERWNRGELADFPRTGTDASVAPAGASRVGGRFVEDAALSIFAIEPSTRALLSPTDQPLYVATSGTILAAVDYRIDLPADDRTGDRRESWSLARHGIAGARLLVDGAVETELGGSRTLAIGFDALPPGRHRLTVEADVHATARRLVRIERERCRTTNNTTTCWTYWDESVSHPEETVTVRESITVETYDLDVSVRHARYPDGDHGFVVYKNHPWRGFEVDGAAVHGVWRFYTARDPAWDRLEERTESGTTRTHSPMHPLQTVAIPLEPGPTTDDRTKMTILETIGVDLQPPTLPDDVALDVVEAPYTASFGLAVRLEMDGGEPSAVTADGLVRGVATTVDPDAFDEVAVHRSELDLVVVDRDDDSVTLEARLTDAVTGEPIDTLAREGYLVITDQRQETGSDGTVRVVVPRSADAVAARFVPDQWWADDPAYLGNSTLRSIDRAFPDGLEAIYAMGVPIALYLLGVFIIDRLSGGGLWPPCRGLR